MHTGTAEWCVWCDADEELLENMKAFKSKLESHENKLESLDEKIDSSCTSGDKPSPSPGQEPSTPAGDNKSSPPDVKPGQPCACTQPSHDESICETPWVFKPRDCTDIKYHQSLCGSGVYTVCVSARNFPIQVYCDMDTDGGGWTVCTLYVLLSVPCTALLQ